MTPNHFSGRIRRIFDVIFSGLVVLFVLAWLVPVVAVFIKIESNGPVFVRQKRSGKNNRHFYCFRFRTVEQTMYAANLSHKVTGVGRLLRKTSLDEMPQFINVFKGEMTIFAPLQFGSTLEYRIQEHGLVTPGPQPRLLKFVESLKFLLPIGLRMEIIDLYYQTKGDVDAMKKDMLVNGLPKWWIKTIVFGNIATVVVATLWQYIKKILQQLKLSLF